MEVVAGTPVTVKEENPQHLIVFKSTSVIIAIVSLAKASHVAKLRVSVRGDYPRTGCRAM